MSARIRVTTSLPDLTDFADDLKHIADEIVIANMQKNIHAKKDIDGKAYQPLSPVTIKMKGHARPLIGKERELIRSFRSKMSGKNKVIVDLNSNREQVGRKLQIEGVQNKSLGKRKFKFFGTNPAMEKQAIKWMAAKVNKLIRTAKTKTRILKSLGK